MEIINNMAFLISVSAKISLFTILAFCSYKVVSGICKAIMAYKGIK